MGPCDSSNLSFVCLSMHVMMSQRYCLTSVSLASGEGIYPLDRVSSLSTGHMVRAHTVVFPWLPEQNSR